MEEFHALPLIPKLHRAAGISLHVLGPASSTENELARIPLLGDFGRLDERVVIAQIQDFPHDSQVESEGIMNL